MDADALRRRRWLTLVVMMATIMQALDGTIANVALPDIQGSLSATQEQVAWVITSYIVSAAIATPLDRQAVLAIAAREGWPAKYRKRGGVFGVIELWIEGRQMMEILTPEMQAEYLAAMSIPNWRGMLAARRAAMEAAVPAQA